MVNVRRSLLEECMTCGLCNNLFEEATTISECLHSFCRKCIYAKLTDKDADNTCPICHVGLGVAPIEKLRADNSLQDVKSKIFPGSSKKVNAPAMVSTAPSPMRRKERSLSSLNISAPHVQTQTKLDGRRTKSAAGKAGALQGPKLSCNEPTNKHESKVHKASVSTDNVSPEAVNPKKVRKTRQKRGASSKIQNSTPQAVIDTPIVEQKRRVVAVWFKLAPYQTPEGSSSQQQLPTRYLRIKDGSPPVSYIHKYLMIKLGLTREDQVEIRCRGDTVLPTLLINDLLSWWLNTCIPEKVKVTVGSSAEQFVMELQYLLKL
ncbi:RING-type E3 ubiquitin transferase [Ranunculus cassubicifolius]